MSRVDDTIKKKMYEFKFMKYLMIFLYGIVVYNLLWFFAIILLNTEVKIEKGKIIEGKL